MNEAPSKRWAGMSPYQLRIIALCIAINMLDGFDILAMAFTAPAIAKDWLLDPATLGMLFSVGLGGMMVGSIILGPMADRFGRRPLILACLILSFIGMLFAGFSATLTQLILARALTGFAVGGMLPCINTMVAEYASPKGRAFSVALMQAGFSIGSSVGGFIAIWFLSYSGWHAVFLAGAAFSALLLPLVWFGMPESLAYLETRPERRSDAQRIRAKLGDVAIADDGHGADGSGFSQFLQGLKGYLIPLALVFGVFFLCVMSFYFINNWTPKILVDSGLSESAGVSGGALLTVGGILSALALGWMSLRRSITPLVVAFALASAAMMLIFGQLSGSLTAIMIVAFVLGTVTSATQIGIYAIFPSLFPSSIRAGATGLAIGAGRLGSVIGPWLAGALLSIGWSANALFAFMAIPYVIAAVLIAMLRRHQKY